MGKMDPSQAFKSNSRGKGTWSLIVIPREEWGLIHGEGKILRTGKGGNRSGANDNTKR